MNIGQRIKNRRKELKMSADELAKRLGKDRSTIYRYEKGDIENMPLDILEPIAKALNTSPSYLMGWENSIQTQPVATAELHFEMIADDDLSEIFADFRTLDARERQIVKDLVHSLAKTKTEA